jgi:hypothetical protein
LFLALVTVYTWPLVTGLGHLLPPTADPRLFSWVLLTMFRNLTSRPELLFHGNAFYPFGNTLSFAEPLLIPALVAGPLDAWTGNPILAYNLTLLVFWALDATAALALRTIGVVGSLTGRFRESHGFVGAKGAPAGTALEGMGARRVTLAVGKVRPTEFMVGGTVGVELTSFALRAARVGRDRADAP